MRPAVNSRSSVARDRSARRSTRVAVALAFPCRKCPTHAQQLQEHGSLQHSLRVRIPACADVNACYARTFGMPPSGMETAETPLPGTAHGAAFRTNEWRFTMLYYAVVFFIICLLYTSDAADE